MSLQFPSEPDEETNGRRDDWLKAREGWQITLSWGLPGWWTATLNGSQVARYNDLADLMDRLEKDF